MAQGIIKLDWALLCFLNPRSSVASVSATNLQSDGDLTNNHSSDKGVGVVSDAPFDFDCFVHMRKRTRLIMPSPLLCKSSGVQIASLICR